MGRRYGMGNYHAGSVILGETKGRTQYRYAIDRGQNKKKNIQGSSGPLPLKLLRVLTNFQGSNNNLMF